MDFFTNSEDAGDMGRLLAEIHNQPLLTESYSYTYLDGQYILSQSKQENMPFHSEIRDALKKTDGILQKITEDLTTPSVVLWNQENEKKAYGNPAWDLGLVINMLSGDDKANIFLQEYLGRNGVQVTVIELYIGILYAKLNKAIVSHDVVLWRRLANNECYTVVYGEGFHFEEISSKTLARLGLPGLHRVE